MVRANGSSGSHDRVVGLLLLACVVGVVVASTPYAATGPIESNAGPSAIGAASLFHVDAKPLTVGLTANPETVTLGEATYLNASVSGGTLPYSYAWTLPSGCLAVDSANISCKPNESGTFTIRLTVSDTSSPVRSGFANISLVVTSSSGGSSLFTEGSIFLFAGVIGTVAAVVTALVIVSLWRRRSRRAPVTPMPESAYVPPPGQQPP